MKLAGTKQYPYGSGSLSDQIALGFDTREEAEGHTDRMNRMLETYDTDPTWNKDYWKSKPAPWHVVEFIK